MKAYPTLHPKARYRWAAALATSLFLGGCATGPQYQRPTLNLPEQYPALVQASPKAQATSEMAGPWWQLFADAQLSRLVELALLHNADLQQATARIDQMEAQWKQAESALWPRIDAGTSANREQASRTMGESDSGGISTTFRGAASTSFEIDLWGKLRHASEAARAQTLASRYSAEVVRQTVASAVAHSYFGIQSLEWQITLSRDSLQARSEEVRLQRLRLAQGSVGLLDVELGEGQRAETALQLRELERQRAVLLAQLGLLIGQPGFSMPATPEQQPTPPVPPAGVPSQLLQRRPDVRQAEQQLMAAEAEVGVARAAMFPSISLTGLGGGESADLAKLFSNGSAIWSLGFGLNLPLFDGGRRLAASEQAKARQVEAVAAYQKAVQSAFKDVAEALANLEAARNSLADAEVRQQAAESALAMVQKRSHAGYSSSFELLEAQRTANSARLQTVTIRQAQLVATVDLFKALGGGWSKDRR